MMSNKLVVMVVMIMTSLSPSLYLSALSLKIPLLWKIYGRFRPCYGQS